MSTYLDEGMSHREHDRLVTRILERFSEPSLRHRYTNQLMPDHDLLSREELTALADGLRWITWDGEFGEEGWIDFSSGPVTEGGACDPDFTIVGRDFAEELASLYGLERVEDSTGVLCWGDFTP